MRIQSLIIVIAIVILAGAGILSLSRTEQRVLSGWRGPLAAGEALAAPESSAPVNALVGVAEPQGRGLDAALVPAGNPLRAPNTVLTQGYGVGTHAPASVWGAVDLALDGNGDGRADPEGTWNQPVYATHAGRVTITRDSWPGGNHIWVTNDQYRTGYAHLAGFAVSDGQWVNAGELIGYIGSTGMSSGPHLDYQVWVWRDGKWVNENPLNYGALDN
ncbi:M23 family metallopeptidase [Chloroflexus sp.]|uniref:M23 family metallopeptidase n=1 Tax=Chloroflexus sp. TaxID=1904827 RepID=UPI0026222755|nr:M23 family metallopeptidase [uncultured Chloroflexus sp.]